MKAKDLARILQTNPEADVIIEPTNGENGSRGIHRVEMITADDEIALIVLNT